MYMILIKYEIMIWKIRLFRKFVFIIWKYTISLYTTLYFLKVIYRRCIIDERYFLKNNLMISIHRDHQRYLSYTDTFEKFEDIMNFIFLNMSNWSR